MTRPATRRYAGGGRRRRLAGPAGLVTAGLALAVAGFAGPALVVPPGGITGPSVAQAAACSGQTGVTVVVDFTAFGVGVQTRCAAGSAGSPQTAGEALQAAGFDQQRVASQPGFLCRIDDRPSPTAQACQRTPPANAYWAFWTARRGGSWSYSPTGVDSYQPPAGSVVGFAFGGGDAPSVAPPAVAPPAVAPPASQAAPASASTRTTQAGQAAQPSGSGPSTPAAHEAVSSAGAASARRPGATAPSRPTAVPTARPTAVPTARPTAVPTARPTAVPTALSTALPAPTASSASGGQSGVGTLAGAVLVATVAGAAVWRARRRTRAAGRPGGRG